MEPRAILGPPGTGKTYTLINLVKERLREGVDPHRIAFVSFSKKAAEEARTRAASELGLDIKAMPYFRTLHSLAFHQLKLSTKDVLSSSDYTRMEELFGVEFRATRSMGVNDGEFFRMGSPGDVYLSIINMARVRGVSMREQFSLSNYDNLDYRQLEIINKGLIDYKEALGKIDFTDMVEQFVERGDSPEFDLLIVDEAQDLVPLQWAMVDKLAEKTHEVVYAGDDDQCIYEWMGVDPGDFISRCKNATVLKQSYRVPFDVHQVSGRLIKRVAERYPKEWKPTERRGSINFHYDLENIDLTEGQWLVLCRTNYIANKVATRMKEMGLLFFRPGTGFSVSQKVIDAAKAWTRLVKGSTINRDELKNMWAFIVMTKPIRRRGKAHFDAMAAEEVMSYDDVAKLLEQTTDMFGDRAPWYEALLNIQATDVLYLRSVLQAGETLDPDNPRIKLSTIHKAKGGEADNVALMLETSRACQTMNDPDSETRAFYVGMTRAKHNLHLIEGRGKWRYEI